MSLKTEGGEKLKFIKSSYRWMNGDTHKQARTHNSRTSLPSHIPKQHTHCVIAPFVFFFHPPSMSASTSHMGSLIPTRSHICHPASHHTVVPSFCSCAELGRNLLLAKPAALFPNIPIILDHTAQQQSTEHV